jgi:hypothetical protein
MTAPDGFPPEMDPFALDAGTAERLLTGAVDVGDAPPQYRAVAATLSALRKRPDGGELIGAPVAAERIAAAVVGGRAVNMAPARRTASRARVLTACVAACGLVVTGGLAAAGALPDSAQRVASAVLGQVGISVPSGDEEPVDHESPPAPPDPVPTTSAVQSSPFGVSAAVPPPAPDNASPTSARGPGRTDPISPTAGSPPPPAVTDDKTKQSAPGAPPDIDNGNGNGNGNGNANGNGTGNGNAFGLNGENGNGNAYGHEKAHGAGAAP